MSLIPGTSRSGVTMTAALALGFKREAAARVSFLMAVPAILLAGVWQWGALVNGPPASAPSWGILGLAAGVAMIVALSCIHVFLRLVERIGMVPFVIYRVLLGALLLIIYWA